MENMNEKLGEAYFDHFQKFLGKPIDNIVFEDFELGWKIQILVFSNVFNKCITFATLGLFHFVQDIGECGELICVVDAAESHVPKILFNTIRTVVLNKMRLGWGMGITGSDKVSPDFVKATGKNSVYITDPLPFPHDFAILKKYPGNITPRVYLCMFISDGEYGYFCSNGAEKFETYLEKNEIDPFDVMRG